jgi:hypothetical protein
MCHTSKVWDLDNNCGMNFKRIGSLLISIALFAGVLSFINFSTVYLSWVSTKAEIEISLRKINYTKDEIEMELYTTLIRTCCEALYFALMSTCFFISGVILLNKK